MLGVVLSGTARPNKHWILSHGSVFPLSQHHQYYDCCRRQRQVDLQLTSSDRCTPCAASRVVERPRGEGSWNVAWDGRPARWLYRPESVWLLYGVCACLAQVEFLLSSLDDSTFVDEKKKNEIGNSSELGQINAESEGKCESLDDYKIRGVLPDGRCLFRSVAHLACLRRGECAPDENRERELADELRASVVEELQKRRKEVAWMIEGDFDEYVKRIGQPHVWGGESELIMACHVLKTVISVFMRKRETGKLEKIVTYGEEYRKADTQPINVLFHGYGHYEILEMSDQRCQNGDIPNSN